MFRYVVGLYLNKYSQSFLARPPVVVNIPNSNSEEVEKMSFPQRFYFQQQTWSEGRGGKYDQ